MNPSQAPPVPAAGVDRSDIHSLAMARWSNTLTGMSPTAAQLFEQALALSDDERTELIVRLLDLVPGLHDRDTGAVIEAAWMEEARQRLSDIEAGRVSTAPWSEARERIFAREP